MWCFITTGLLVEIEMLSKYTNYWTIAVFLSHPSERIGFIFPLATLKRKILTNNEK